MAANLLLAALLTMTSTVSRELRPLVCPPGVVTTGAAMLDWSLRYGRCYLPVWTINVTWEEATKICERYGGKLVQPAGFKLTEEVGAIATATDSAFTHFWTGYNRRGVTGNLSQGQWSDGESAVADVGVWGHREPAISAGDCAYIKLQSDNVWKWHMANCDLNLPFVCQTTPCPDNTFQCDKGNCVGQSNVCDGQNNCADGSDERHCPKKCSYLIKQSQGTLRYPSSSSSYFPSQTCQWVLEGAIGSRLQIQFLSLNTEPEVDIVEIWLGGRTVALSTLIRRFSGTAVDDLIVSNSNTAIIRFLSDDSYQDNGFQLAWQSDFQCSMESLSAHTVEENQVAWSTQQTDMTTCGHQCSSNIKCVAYVYDRFTRRCAFCSIMPKPRTAACCTLFVKTCPGHSGLPKLPSIPGSMGDLLASASLQQFYSPLYPVYYVGGMVTKWIIQAPGHQLITLNILDLDLAAGDSISIFDGSSSRAAKLATMSGIEITAAALMTADDQRILISTQNTLLVQFNSYHQSNVRGFLFTYQAGCQFNLSASTGRIVSPGYLTSFYPNIMQCSWAIQVPHGQTLIIAFDPIFGFEDGKDYLQIKVDGSLVRSDSGFTGSKAPEELVAQKGLVELVMVTGATGRAVGFSATFNAGCISVHDISLAVNYSTDYGQSVVVRCARDNVFTSISPAQDSVVVHCQKGGRWSHDPFPSCTRDFCGPPSDISSGYLLSVSGLYSGDVATYACEPGFQSSTPMTIKCNTGSWEMPPVCSSIHTCPMVQRPSHGNFFVMAGNGIDHGSVINFTCVDTLYELHGSANLLCENGQWSNSIPTCERVQCPVPQVTNGIVTHSKTVMAGSTLTIECKPGFMLDGLGIILCGQTAVPACLNVNECQGGAGCSQHCVDTEGSYFCTCAAGYQLLPDQHSCADFDECAQANGGCSEMCINSPGSYRCECTGSSQLYVADSQFGISIPAAETGLDPWNVYYLNHTCISPSKVTCPAPHQSINNGYLLGETGNFSEGQSVTYLCNLGYSAQGPTTLTCQRTGEWSSSVPVCVVATCPVPVIAMGTVSPQTPAQYFDYVTVICDLDGVKPKQLQSRCLWDRTTQSYRVDTSLLRCDIAVREVISGVDCGTPTRLPGSLPYTVTSTTYSAQFSFNCHAPLFKRVGKSAFGGNEIVTCGADGIWDFGDLHCEGPTCSDPGTFPGTRQIAISYEEFSILRYTCERTGFELTSPLPLYCQFDARTGNLAWNGTAPKCTDTEPPSFSDCPESEQVVEYLSRASFTKPTASDNVMVSELTVVPDNYLVRNVVHTDLQVVYIARDHAANIGLCVISIKVQDESPPQIDCQSFFEEQLFAETQRTVYDPLNFVRSQTDDSGSVALTFSIKPLIIDHNSVGEIRTIKITASDPSNNTDTCLIQVKVTAPWCVPWSLHVDNGYVVCSQQSNGGYSCNASCHAGYRFFEKPDTNIINISCAPGKDWDRSSPICTSYYYVNYRLSFQMEYRTRESSSVACQSNYMTQLRESLPALTAAFNSLCTGSIPAVNVTAAANDPVVIKSNQFGIYGTFHLDLDSSPNSEAEIRQCVNTITSAISSVSSSLQTIRTLRAWNNCPASEVVRFKTFLHNGINCQNNQESRVEPSTRSFQCVSCIPGYTSSAGSRCSACSSGSYFNSSSGTCQRCPPGTRSQKSAARTVEDCYLHCAYGYISSTGEAPCRPCPRHTYSFNRTYCAACPAGFVTRNDAQGYLGSCQRVCQAGTYSYDGLSPCKPCPTGFYQPQAGAKTCIECQSDRTTKSSSSISINQCVPAEPILCDPNPCFNGTCVIVNHDFRCLCPAGLTGSNCQNQIRPCDSNPCYNDASCINKDTSYECICTNSHTVGSNCEIDTENGCSAGGICQNFGACQDRVDGYSCLCPSFSNYTNLFGQPGSHCTQLRDPCQEDPCQHGATCVNYGSIRQKCHCIEGYEGESCQIDKDYCWLQPCQNYAQCQEGPGSRVICSCLLGFTGAWCEVRTNHCESIACGPFSACVDDYITGQVHCYCIEGYRNVSGICELVVKNTCQSSPCENNATCVADNTNYQCFCLPGYEGANCQHNIDDCASQPCLNGGVCHDHLNAFHCDCPSDTLPPDCRDAFDQCGFAFSPCNPYGTGHCIDHYQSYSCVCLPGFRGINCTEGQTNCASFPCRHGGTCTDSGNSYFCVCADGFEGPDCQHLHNFCSSNPCANGGTCVNTDTGTVCKCQPGYRGKQCQIDYNMCTVTKACAVAGSVCKTDSNNQVSCFCPPGHTGLYCQLNSSICHATTCQNGGICSDASGSISCSCPAGFSGIFCEVNNDDCKSSPCPANSLCIDDISSYTCICHDDKIGVGCYKDLSMNFDLILQPSATFLSFEPFVWQLSSAALTVAVWIRFTERRAPGIVLTLYGMITQNSLANPKQLVLIEHRKVTLDLAGLKTLPLSLDIDDGYWHHIALTWDGVSGQTILYVDNTISASISSYGQGIRLPFGWLLIGGEYNAVSNIVDRTQGMVGRLSRLYVSINSLSAEKLSQLYTDSDVVPLGSSLLLTKHLLSGSAAVVDYVSQLTQEVCRSSTTCPSIDQVTSQPKVVHCPGNQVIESDRPSYPTWTTATFLSNDPVSSNYIPGTTEMGWGYYGVANTQSDGDGDTAVCTFLLEIRRGSCSTPVPPRFGSQSCTTTSAGIQCVSNCNVGFTRSKPEPLFLSCGIYGMFDTAVRVLPYTFSSCTPCQEPSNNIVMELNYRINSESACNIAHTVLSDHIRSTLQSLNAQWKPDLCGTSSCGTVHVQVDCQSGLSQVVLVTTYLQPVHEIVTSVDNLGLRTVTEILAIAAVDNKAFSYPGTAVPDLSSLLIRTNKTCPKGKLLLNDCCISCGLGHFYSTDTDSCTACPEGTYIDKLDQQGSSTSFPCKSCPTGQTTPTAGSQSSSECTDSCLPGSYYNLTQGQCLPCPLGFYEKNPGSYLCDACPFLKTTAREGSNTSFACFLQILKGIGTYPTTFGASDDGAITQSKVLSWPEAILIIFSIILLIILVLLVLFFCFRQRLIQHYPFFSSKVKPEVKAGLQNTDRFNETRLKFISYNISEPRACKLDKDLTKDNVAHTSSEIQIPILEEKPHEKIEKKSVHLNEHSSQKRRKKHNKKHHSQEAAHISKKSQPALITPIHQRTTEPSTTADKTEPKAVGAVSKPQSKLDHLHQKNFMTPPVSSRQNVSFTDSHTPRIIIDSDDDER